MPNQQLSYSEKLQLLSDLRKFYMEDFWIIYDVSEELWRLKWWSIWLILDSLKTIFKWDQEPNIEEIISVLTHVLNKDFLDDIYKDRNESEVCFMKAWFWCAVAILMWDKKIINFEKGELEKVWWVEINCNLI